MPAFTTVQEPPSDPILDITTAFKNCNDEKKVDLGVGAYRNDAGKPVVFDAVKRALIAITDETIEGTSFKEYIPMHGDAGFIQENVKMLLGEQYVTTTAAIQSTGGTGALRMAMESLKYRTMGYCNHVDYPDVLTAEFMKDEFPTIHLSNPTWPNHNMICHHAGLKHQFYEYLNTENLCVNEEAMLRDLKNNVKKGDAVLLHAIGHNPTGCDASPESFKKALKIIKDKEAICILDIAYWGFVSGDLIKDKWAVDMAIATDGLQLMICQSFAKNMGLYGERLGVFMMKCESADDARRVKGFIQLISRGMVSSCARHASDIAYRILSDPELKANWMKELSEIAARINKMRTVLREELEKLTGTNWNHITNQRGMFAYTGLKPKEVELITAEHNVFLAKSGRISISGLNSGNVHRVAAAMADVIKKAKASADPPVILTSHLLNGDKKAIELTDLNQWQEAFDGTQLHSPRKHH